MYRAYFLFCRFLMVWLFVLFVVFLSCTAQSPAAEFSVVTRLFSSSETVPLGENTTIFQGDKVYDLPATGDQITFFDKTENQFVVVNTAKKTWTRISTKQLLQYTAWVKEKLMESDDPLLRFCAAPQLNIHCSNTGSKRTHLMIQRLGFSTVLLVIGMLDSIRCFSRNLYPRFRV